MSRPEHQLPPELFYNETEANKYSNNTRIMEIQSELSARALELLSLDNESSLLLDIGCGSGISGTVITESGHQWIGVDISSAMLAIAKEKNEGEIIHNDIGSGLPFKGGVFDGAISISAVQWLCYSCKSVDNPKARLKSFFTNLYACLKRDARAVIQFYPENADQSAIVFAAAQNAGFTGGLIIDYPNSSKNRKHFLVLNVSPAKPMPKALDDTIMLKRMAIKESKGNRTNIKHRPHKNDGNKKSKYSGRNRGPRF